MNVQYTPIALERLDYIFDYTETIWGFDQALRYTRGLRSMVEQAASGNLLTRAIPKEYGVIGSFIRFKSHFVYLQEDELGEVFVMTILHVQMNQAARLLEDLNI